MRISDWSSDVCSSDLEVPGDAVFAEDLVDAAIFTDALQKAALRDRKLLCHGRACWLLLTNNTLQFVSRRVQSFFRRSEEHTSELQSLMRISYAVFCLKKKNITN